MLQANRAKLGGLESLDGLMANALLDWKKKKVNYLLLVEVL